MKEFFIFLCRLTFCIRFSESIKTAFKDSGKKIASTTVAPSMLKKARKTYFSVAKEVSQSKAWLFCLKQKELRFLLYILKPNRIFFFGWENEIKWEGVHWYTLVQDKENEIWKLHCIHYGRIHDAGGGLLNSKRKKAWPSRRTALVGPLS